MAPIPTDAARAALGLAAAAHAMLAPRQEGGGGEGGGPPAGPVESGGRSRNSGGWSMEAIFGVVFLALGVPVAILSAVLFIKRRKRQARGLPHPAAMAAVQQQQQHHHHHHEPVVVETKHEEVKSEAQSGVALAQLQGKYSGDGLFASR
jgi:hypothetical protein